MQPIVRPAARCAGPEQDIKLLSKDVYEFKRPVDNSPAFSFSGFSSDHPFAHQQGERTPTLILKLIQNLTNGSDIEIVDPDPEINSG